MTDLDEKEQNHVRVALRVLRLRVGTWRTLAKGLRVEEDTIEKVANARGRNVTARMALRVARFAEVSIDDLLAGKIVPAGRCPHCGRGSDFEDENTTVEGGGPAPTHGSGLKLVR